LRIPLIDLGPFFTGSAEGRGQVVAEVRAACEQTGCMLITGHGVPLDLIERVDRLWRAFFDEPLERKLEAAPADQNLFRGYYGMGSGALSYANGKPTPPDLRELYFINRLDPLPEPYLARLGPTLDYVTHPNIWPAGPPGLREASEAYYRALERLAGQLLAIFAVALDLPEDFFADKVDKHNSTFNILHYPDQREPPLPDQLRCGAHTDFGGLAIFHQDGAPGGLQIQGRDGAWTDVPELPGALGVNLGDTMSLWTNHRWISPMHRVNNPPPEVAASSRRQSLLYFLAPNFDALIECVPSCIRPGDPPSPPPMTVGELILSRARKATEQEKG
jgi:isopenicillin N synthase-like dioxygenase